MEKNILLIEENASEKNEIKSGKKTNFNNFSTCKRLQTE